MSDLTTCIIVNGRCTRLTHLHVPEPPVTADRCVCDGAAYHNAEENRARHPFIVNPGCPVHAPVTADHTPEMPDFGCDECGVAGGHYPLCSRRKPTTDHTPDLLIAARRMT